MNTFYSNGKLLITGEYVVLDGAKALAIPTKPGQSLTVTPIQENILAWESYDHKNELWFQHDFNLETIQEENFNKTDSPVLQRLTSILFEANKLNFSNLKKSGYKVVTKLDFPNNWGLGSSSTLISNIALWFNIDPYLLLEKTFGGSGYDIACARKNKPIVFELPEQKTTEVQFDPVFSNQLFFVHLNRKQNSRESIINYRKRKLLDKTELVNKITNITEKIITCSDLKSFRSLVDEHENLISAAIGRKTIKEELFPEYTESIKSLGGWGGDFIMATGTAEEQKYFNQKGYTTIIPFSDMKL